MYKVIVLWGKVIYIQLCYVLVLGSLWQTGFRIYLLVIFTVKIVFWAGGGYPGHIILHLLV